VSLILILICCCSKVKYLFLSLKEQLEGAAEDPSSICFMFHLNVAVLEIAA
jgi:hypothetical protein